MKRVVLAAVVVVVFMIGFYARDVWKMLYTSPRAVSPVLQEFNPSVQRIAELHSQNKWKIVSIDFYGVNEKEVQSRKQKYVKELVDLGISVPDEKVKAILTNYPGGRQHIVGIRAVVTQTATRKDKQNGTDKNVIEQAVRLEEEWQHLEAKSTALGFFCWPTEDLLCRRFVALAEQDQQIAEAIRLARRSGLSVWVDDDSHASIYSVYVNPTASQKKILKHLGDASGKREVYNEDKQLGNTLFLDCVTSHPEKCRTIVKTAQTNPELIKLFKNAYERGIRIIVKNEFRFGAGWMVIDGRASAKRIARFFETGK